MDRVIMWMWIMWLINESLVTCIMRVRACVYCLGDWLWWCHVLTWKSVLFLQPFHMCVFADSVINCLTPWSCWHAAFTASVSPYACLKSIIDASYCIISKYFSISDWTACYLASCCRLICETAALLFMFTTPSNTWFRSICQTIIMISTHKRLSERVAVL